MNRYDNYINGELVPAATYSPNVNPSDVSDVVGEYAQASTQDVEFAAGAARRAFRSWSLHSPQERFDILDAAGTRIRNRRDDLALLLAREEGKPVAEALAEVDRAGQVFKFYAGESVRLTGEVVSSAAHPTITVEITREPLGVIGLITPWNFPIAIPAWKLAPALAYGNTVVFKPAELAPGSAWELVRILADCGLPNGVLNLVMGPGSVVGETVLDSPDISAVSFTGSPRIGQHVAIRCAETQKRVQTEMSGKNPMVVLDDANLVTAVNACLAGAYLSSGERCTASSRIIVTQGIHDRFVEALTERMDVLRVGHALDEETIIGPVIDQRQLDRVLEYVSSAAEEGGNVAGGLRLTRRTKGFYLSPALVTGSTNDMRVNREEVFGPVASVIQVRDYDAALEVANDTEFGLSAGICSASFERVSHFKRHVEAGMVMVNMPTAGSDYHVPFGGRKASSYGPREQGSYAREFYTCTKTAYSNPDKHHLQ